jgi:hypothetical protein
MAQPMIIQKAAPNPILIVGIGIVGFLAYKKLSSYLETVKQKEDLIKDQSTDIKPGQDKKNPKKLILDLNGKPIKSANLATIAIDLYNALHPGWYKPTEQERAVRAFKNTPFGYVKQLEQIYLNKYGENLKETLADKLSDTNFIKIKPFFAY